MKRLYLLTAYQGLMGSVKNEDINSSLKLMGKGMLGIFVVMLLIYLVIVVLNKIAKSEKKKAAALIVLCVLIAITAILILK